MGEQLRSPFIDSIASIARPKSIMTSSKLKNREQEYRQVIPIKDSIDKILEEFYSHLPSSKKIPHGVTDAIYYPSSETIIALCYENYLLNYSPVSGAFIEKQLSINITSLSECQDENFVIAIGTTDILFINIISLDIESQIPFNNITNCCPFSVTEIIVSTYNEIFVINTNTYEKTKADIEAKNITSISVGDGLLIISDEKGLFSYSKDFALNASVSVFNIRLLKFSESFETIIAINDSEISLLNRELQVTRMIYISNPVLDAILNEKAKILTFCDSEGCIWLCDLRTEKRKIKISAHSTQISRIFH